MLRRKVGTTGVESEAELVSDLGQRSVDSYRDRKVDGGANQRKKDRRTITLPTSHASIATRPDDIVQLIEEASNAVVAKAAGFH